MAIMYGYTNPSFHTEYTSDLLTLLSRTNKDSHTNGHKVS